jgi:cation:H+ antiporter
MSYLAVLAGLALLFGGGDAMLRGAVGVARRFHLSDIFVGIAIVGFATSAPELFVSVDAALANRPGIALGNVIGSNTANLLLILGTGAIIRKITAAPDAIRRDGIMAILAMLATACIVFAGGIDRLGGGLLFIALLIYLTQAFITARKTGAALADLDPPPKPMALHWLLAFLLGGLLALGIGAELLIHGAVQIAEAAGLSDRAISVSLVAIGTSLPELATTIVAAKRNQSDVAIGNVLGSCVFNVFGILGLTALIMPMSFPSDGFLIDVGVMSITAVGVLALTLSGRGIGQAMGLTMLTIYLAYMASLYIGPM